jgi:RimJ/RimL family protein N-acetyltransferase
LAVTLTPCANEPELSDPAVTGEFAAEMASLAQVENVPPFCGYVGRQDGVPVGFGGFKGEPDESGAVEIGYLTFPLHVRRGVATQVAAGLVDIARHNGAVLVVAHTMPQRNASTRVLEKNGFAHTGSAMDEDIGEAWRWELAL